MIKGDYLAESIIS